MQSPTSSADVIDLFAQYVVPNYGRYPVCLVRGEGSHVWDAEGNRYLDLFPGWGCNLLGHCPSPVVKAVQDQAAELIHVPNTWYIESQGRWAEALSKHSFGGQAFFCNSGAEANEAAIKLARLHSPPERFKIVTFTGGFHGRTLAAVTATAQPKYHEGLGPLVAGFSYAPYGDLDKVSELIDDETAAILVEPIQGEGGIRIPPEGFLAGLRELCDEHDLLLMFDEVQTGCGRTGNWFAYQHFDVIPDVMTLAKAVCGGVAGGAMLTTKEIAPSLRPGMHAATFGGNPLAAAAGVATLRMIEDEGLLRHAQEMSELFRRKLTDLAEVCDFIREVRVLGMMVGLELECEGMPFVQSCMENNLLINCTQGNVLRLLPAMNITPELVEEGCDILSKVLLGETA
ncbi:MAG: aspartate aminotransferase family protein [Pirellulales bacterium]|nr:aspartate aminotransferase family protein [Pirellulales bacterium]